MSANISKSLINGESTAQFNSDDRNLTSLPVELLSEITSFLNVEGVREFRLANNAMKVPTLTQHLALAPSADAVNSWAGGDGPVEPNETALFWLNRRNLRLPPTVTDQELEGLIQRGYLKSLRKLDLSQCAQLTDQVFLELAALQDLEILILKGCKQLSNGGLANLSTLKKLQVLDLSECNRFDDSGLAPLAKLYALKTLKLAKCEQINGSGLEYIRTYALTAVI